MKKLLLIIALPLLMSLGINENSSSQSLKDIEFVDCKYRQCNATAKSTGKRCKRCVSKSSDYQCWQHKDKISPDHE